MEILKCENVRKVYGFGDNQVTALDGIDLSIRKGGFVAIAGASGSIVAGCYKIIKPMIERHLLVLI